MKAIIMAGGEGTRLRPLTCNRPKPMVPVMNKPVMEYAVELLKKHSINDIGITLQYMPRVIKDYFEDGSEFGVSISYFVEESPLGTAGSVKNAQDFLDDTFVVISGDALTDINLSKALAFHKKKESLATLILTSVDTPLEYGVVMTNTEGRVEGFLEKPNWSEVFSDTVNTGIYILEPQVLEFIPPDKSFDFSKDLFPILLREKKPMYGYVTKEYWCDIGDISAYRQCHFDVLQKEIRLDLEVKETEEGLYIHDTALIKPGAVIVPPVYIGKNCIIESGAVISSYSVLGEGTIVKSSSNIKRVITHSSVQVGRKCELKGCVLCDGVMVGDDVAIFEQSIIGDKTIIEEEAQIKPSIKIWPEKFVEAGSVVSANMVWGLKYHRNLFGENGIIGQVNVDVTPEFVSKLGTAFGSMIDGNLPVGVGCDGKNISMMLKGSVAAGLLSTGKKVYDFASLTLPAIRMAIKDNSLQGGIYLTAMKSDGIVSIEFLNKNAIDIERSLERKIENVFKNENFKRADSQGIKETVLVDDYLVNYLEKITQTRRNQDGKMKVLMDFPSDMIKKLFLSVSKKIGVKCDYIESEDEIPTKAFADYITEKGYDFGAKIDENCERMQLVDEKGNVLNSDVYITLLSLINMERNKTDTIVVPVSAPSAVESICEEHGVKIIRTKSNKSEFMKGLLEYPAQFALYFDSLISFMELCSFLKTNDTHLSEISKKIPSIYMAKTDVTCSEATKSKIVRKLMEESKGSVELLDGVKIYKDGGWVLVLPHNKKSACRIVAEGFNQEFADDLTSIYTGFINKMDKEK